MWTSVPLDNAGTRPTKGRSERYNIGTLFATGLSMFPRDALAPSEAQRHSNALRNHP